MRRGGGGGRGKEENEEQQAEEGPRPCRERPESKVPCTCRHCAPDGLIFLMITYTNEQSSESPGCVHESGAILKRTYTAPFENDMISDSHVFAWGVQDGPCCA